MPRISLIDADRAERLVQSRLTLHWAAQLPAAAGASLLTPREDHAHTSLTWSHDAHGLLGQPLNAGGLRAGLRFAGLALIVRERGEDVTSLPLPGRSLAEALAWLDETLRLRLSDARPLALPTHELPSHLVGEGAPFASVPEDDLAQLTDWFAGADRALRRVADGRGGAEVRCWPHHFDIATLLVLDEGDTPEQTRSVGAGMTPGDASYPVPYLYVTPWPYPAPGQTLPAPRSLRGYRTV